MSIKNIIIVFSILSSLICLHENTSLAASLSLSTNNYYLRTTENFNSKGQYFPIGDNKNIFNHVSSDLKIAYTSRSKFQTAVGFQFAYGYSDNSIKQRTYSDITKTMLDIAYLEVFSSWSLKMFLSAYYPFNRVDQIVKKELSPIIISEYDAGIITGLELVKFIGGFKFLLQGSYNLRDEGRSHLALWNVKVQRKLNHFGFGVGVEGYKTVIKDVVEVVDSDEEGLTYNDKKSKILESGNAGSFAFYSVNPENVKFNVWALWNLKGIILRPGYKASFYGKNSSKDQMYYLNLTYFFNPRKQKGAQSSFEIEKQPYNNILFN